jgi:NAD(P)-dependent dehydrogenase (short-subunit alcohol dehydrogenase family)
MYVERIRLDGRVALVTGAGGGRMGTESAVALAEAGATVVGVDVELEQMAPTRERIDAFGGSFVPMAADVTDVQALSRVIDDVWQLHGGIRHLVQVIGGSQGVWARLDEYPDDAFDQMLAFNLGTMFRVCREVAHRMIDGGIEGSIVNFASLAGATGAPYHGPYGAAKAGVVSLTKTMAVEWGQFGIRVNAVAPGSTQTSRSALRPVKRDPVWTPPLGRGCALDEIASAVLFFVSDFSSGISGQTLSIDAGSSARSPLGSIEHYAQFATGADP